MKRKIALLLIIALILSFIPVIVVNAADTTIVYQKITTMDELTTGGVNSANIKEYIDAPFIHAVGGGWVCPKAEITAGNWEKITKLCEDARKAAKGE